MTQAHKTPGAVVQFKPMMFEAPYAPWFDEHKGETFEVIDGYVYHGHVKLKSLKNGEVFIIHDDEIQTIKKAKHV